MALSLLLVPVCPLAAQEQDAHFWTPGATVPGAVGTRQLTRGGPLPGYYQPVEIIAPPGTTVALPAGGQFDQPQPVPAQAGLLIGAVYRLRVTNIPNNPGIEVFPTIELVDRTYPPAGQERRFAIPIELTEEDLRLAMSGNFVTRVVYVENPQFALPAKSAGGQNWFDVGPGRDPLAVADNLGRPIAILRLGARLPSDPNGPPSSDFLYNSPPWLKFPPISAPTTAHPISASAGRTAKRAS